MNTITHAAPTLGLQLAFEDTGSGPPLVVLHGLFGSGGNWRRWRALWHRITGAVRRPAQPWPSPWADSMGYVEMADDVRALIARGP